MKTAAAATAAEVTVAVAQELGEAAAEEPRSRRTAAAGAKEQWAATAVEVPSTEEPARKSQRPGEPRD